MNQNTHPNDPNYRETQAAPRQEVQGSITALHESALAVDLAAVEFDRLIATAHRFPRNLDVVRQQLEQIVCFDEAAAENAVYALPRGDKPIVGPSIGFANALAAAYGNCWDDGRWLYTDRREKIVVGGGVFVDWQTNRRTTISEQRRICGKNGMLYNEDMIVVTSKAASAVARRNAILAGVPRPLWFPAYEKALFIVRGTEATLPEKRDSALKALMAFGVRPEQVFMYLGVRDLKDIGIEHIPTLRGMYAQLRDGVVTPEEMFDPRKMTSGSATFDHTNPLGDTTDDEGAQAPQAQGQQPQQQTPQGGGAPASTSEGQGGGEQAQVAKPRRTNSKRKAAPAGDAQGAPAGEQTAKAPETPAAVAQQQPAALAQPAPAAQQPMPKTAEEYEVHAAAWIAASTSASALEDQWRSERDLRGNCMVVEDVFDRIKKAKDAKVAELKAKG